MKLAMKRNKFPLFSQNGLTDFVYTILFIFRIEQKNKQLTGRL